MTSYVLKPETFDAFDKFIGDCNNMNYGCLCNTYSKSQFARFMWYMGCDGEDKLVVFSYFLAKWVDQKISRGDRLIKTQTKNIFESDIDYYISELTKDIDENFIDTMFENKKTYSSLEDSLIEMLGVEI